MIFRIGRRRICLAAILILIWIALSSPPTPAVTSAPVKRINFTGNIIPRWHEASPAVYDWRELKRWGISETRLSPGSVVQFRDPTLWEEYRWYIIISLVIFLLQAGLIAGLVVSRLRRRRAEIELRETKELMEMAASVGGLGWWARDLKTGDFSANSRLRSLFGFGPQDVLRFEDVVGRVHPDDRAQMVSAVERARQADEPVDLEYRAILPDGKERWLAARGSTILDREGCALRRVGNVIDISARKQAEEALEKERAFLRQVIDIDPNFIFAKDREGRFTLVNQAVAEAYGTTVAGLIGKTDADFNSNLDEVAYFHRMDLEVIDNLQERFIDEEQLTDARGQIRWLQTVKRPIVGKGGVADQVLGASTDITRHKHAETELQRQREELAHVTRVSLMGELAASLAHELNQPLTAILSNAQAAQRFLMAKAVNLDEVREILKDIVDDNNRAGEIIRKIRALVRKEDIALTRLDLTAVIRDVVSLVRSDAILRNVKLDYQASESVAAVRGDRIQLQQVMLNLLLNAFDAMKECGADERQALVRVNCDDVGFVEVSVRDRGIGFTRDKLDRMFEPFFTTKKEGLGMGLSISRSIVEAHGGRLWAENNQYLGVTFYMVLPASPDAEKECEIPA